MDSSDFVAAIEKHVRDCAVEGTLAQLRRPSGRRVPEGLAARSELFNGLSDADAQRVQAVIQDAAHSAVFGLLAVLDGVRIIDDTRGHFELCQVAEGRVLINPPDLDLHDLLTRIT